MHANFPPFFIWKSDKLLRGTINVWLLHFRNIHKARLHSCFEVLALPWIRDIITIQNHWNLVDSAPVAQHAARRLVIRICSDRQAMSTSSFADNCLWAEIGSAWFASCFSFCPLYIAAHMPLHSSSTSSRTPKFASLWSELVELGSTVQKGRVTPGSCAIDHHWSSSWWFEDVVLASDLAGFKQLLKCLQSRVQFAFRAALGLAPFLHADLNNTRTVWSTYRVSTCDLICPEVVRWWVPMAAMIYAPLLEGGGPMPRSELPSDCNSVGQAFRMKCLGPTAERKNSWRVVQKEKDLSVSSASCAWLVRWTLKSLSVTEHRIAQRMASL